MSVFFRLVEEAPSVQLREGVDYTTPQEREQVLAERGLTGEPRYEPTVEPRAKVLALRMLREIRWFERTQRFPGGKPWDEQPWWRIELYEAFWAGRDSGAQSNDEPGIGSSD